MDDKKSETKRVQKHLYRVAYRMKNGEWSVYHVAIFRDNRGKNRKFRLPEDLTAARKQLGKLEGKYFYGDEDLDAERAANDEKKRAEQQAAEEKAMTLEKWLATCRTLPEMLTVTKGNHKGQARREGTLNGDAHIHYHLTRHLGSKPLVELEQEDLVSYKDTRLGETILKRGKATAFPVMPGTVRNELRALKRALDLAKKHGKNVPELDFGVAPRAGTRERTLTDEEEQKLYDECKKNPWFLRLSLFANETGLSRVDIARMRQSWINEKLGTITVEGGRRKTSTRQICPLTDTAREILRELRKVQPIRDPNPFVFTRPDGTGRPLSVDMISMQMTRACNLAGINEAPPKKKEGERWTPEERAEFLAKRFTFHSFRKCVAKRWNREKRPGHHALLGLGWSSPAMYIHYTRLGEYDIADEFGTSKKFAPRLLRSTASVPVAL